ncbi:MAG: alpha/beta hydrolase [Acidimicrobiales bacterium]
MPIETRPCELTTGDGLRLPGDVANAERAEVALAVVVCHPHPLYGGSRFTPVVETVFRRAGELGLGAVRFDFRGVGDAEGEHGGGVDERLDVIAAIDLAAATWPDAAVVLAGWSFGAEVALTIDDHRHVGWFGVAPQFRPPAPCVAAADPRPLLALVPAHDQFAPPPVAAERTEGWATTELVTVEGADHSLLGHQARVADEFERFVGSLAGDDA